ncbi:acyl-CoA dehydrogenase family protein [Rhizobium sp. LjRoot30]|uniref:acyl-CoA dehydrogenase family protein n=1 Tax=Rhizobium sp. LjRoot30 TaxID=3342320 RepID=UPI003ECCCDE9
MGTVSHLHDRTRPVAHRIASEEEALDIARTLAGEFAPGASDRDINRILPYAELDLLAQSGLLGITVPSEYDGIDVSNAVLADVIAILAQADSAIAEVPQSHFQFIEALRLAGSEEQKKFFYARALGGDLFAGAIIEQPHAEGAEATRLAPDGIGHRINSRKYYSTGVLFSDWVVVAALDPQEKPVFGILSRKADGVQVIDDWDGFGQRTAASGTTVLQNVYINADSVVRDRTLDPHSTIAAIGQIIHAGIDLGIARAAFADLLGFIRSRAAREAGDPLLQSRIGQLATELEAATALLERAGKKIDFAQINGNDTQETEATLSTAAARVVTSRIAAESANALFELADAGATKIGLNLDRHWRNIRAHSANEPVRKLFQETGRFHLNS